MMAARNEIIDIAKAIGIILMVIGHTRCPEYLRHLIYLFHMPLFFILSGYFLQKKSDVGEYAKKQFMKLMILRISKLFHAEDIMKIST